MNQTHNTNELPWWEAELPAIRAKQHIYLKRRLPAFSADHEDLLNATLLGLADHIRKNQKKCPKSWFRTIPPELYDEIRQFHRLGSHILRRRITDLFRKRVSLVSLSDSNNPIDLPDDKTASPDRKMLLAKLLQVTISALDEIEAEDRDLIALISEDNKGVRKALNPHERKRLQRAREKLKKKIASRLGAELKDLLSSS